MYIGESNMTMYRVKCEMCKEWIPINTGDLEVECPKCGYINLIDWVPRVTKSTFMAVEK